MWFRRRRRPESPPLLPVLDRLAELVERVVALVDAVGAAPVELVTEQHNPPAAAAAVDGWVAFVPSPAGYRLLERGGAPPAPGEEVELEGAVLRVLRLGPSPLPGDRRRCAFLEREERQGPERTSDR